MNSNFRDYCPDQPWMFPPVLSDRVGLEVVHHIERLCAQHPGSVPLYLRLIGGSRPDQHFRADGYQIMLTDHLLKRLETLAGEGCLRLLAPQPKSSDNGNGKRNYRQGQ